MGILWVRISSLSSYLGKTLFPPRLKAHFAGCCISGWQSLPINNLNISFNSLWAYIIFVKKLAKYRWLSIICDLRVFLFLVFSFCPVLLAFDYLGERCCLVWVLFFLKFLSPDMHISHRFGSFQLFSKIGFQRDWLLFWNPYHMNIYSIIRIPLPTFFTL